MRVAIAWGRNQGEIELPVEQMVEVRRGAIAPPFDNPGAAVAAALEQPFGFPPLRNALTPDDHVAVVVDESLVTLPRLLPPLLAHLRQAQIELKRVTLVCAAPSTGQPWLEELPDEFQDVQVEVHQPDDRKKLAYLATMRQGRRLYLNRTVVDADQTVVLGRRAYDCLLGHGGAAGTIFPILSDEATQRDALGHLSLAAPDAEPWPWRREAAEAAWLLGVPFVVQVIEGADGAVLHVVGGPVESGAEGDRLLDERWRVKVSEPADVVVATISGDPARHTFADLARAFAAAARVVNPGGNIVLLTEAAPRLGPSSAALRKHEIPAQALRRLQHDLPDDFEAGFQWVSAAQQAKLYLLSKWPIDVAEELFTTPLDNLGQLPKLLRGQVLFLPDAHRSMATVTQN